MSQETFWKISRLGLPAVLSPNMQLNLSAANAPTMGPSFSAANDPNLHPNFATTHPPNMQPNFAASHTQTVPPTLVAINSFMQPNFMQVNSSPASFVALNSYPNYAPAQSEPVPYIATTGASQSQYHSTLLTNDLAQIEPSQHQPATPNDFVTTDTPQYQSTVAYDSNTFVAQSMSPPMSTASNWGQTHNGGGVRNTSSL